MPETPTYLAPYFDAAQQHGAGFLSLLWASPDTQAARFDAMQRLTSFKGRTVLDVGCGRADLLDYLLLKHLGPADYIGIETIPDLLHAAREKEHRGAKIIDADFVLKPASMFVGAQIVAISGSLNTLDTPTFYSTIRRAFDATAEVLMFNFLDAPSLAAASYLTWHKRDDVLAFARTLSPSARIVSDYLDGDSTIAIQRSHQG